MHSTPTHRGTRCVSMWLLMAMVKEKAHVSVIAFLMRGEFDDHLKWPFRGHVVIQLCNQLQDKYHRGHTIDF